MKPEDSNEWQINVWVSLTSKETSFAEMGYMASLLPHATHHPVFYLLTYIVLINSIRLALEYFFF